MKVVEGRINAVQMNQDGSMQKFFTTEINKFAEMEHILCNSAFYTMKATARFVFGVTGRDHILVAIEYHNEMDSCGKRAKVSGRLGKKCVRIFILVGHDRAAGIASCEPPSPCHVRQSGSGPSARIRDL